MEYSSYCGPAPTPANILARWNFDPWLLLAMLAVTGLFVMSRRDGSRGEKLSFCLGMLTLFVLFVSPLCAATVALFSARVAHHALLVAVAAPLLAMSLPWMTRNLATLSAPLLILHAVIFWFWHAPAPYELALANTGVYWLMQTTLLATAIALWASILGAQAGTSIAVLLGATVQMGFLGALLVFAEQPLYASHFATTQSFGVDPLSDQQLAGLIMWVPASLPYLLIALKRLLDWLQQPHAQTS